MGNVSASDNTKQEMKSDTVEDIKEGVGILERIAQIFVSIFSIFKSKEK